MKKMVKKKAYKVDLNNGCMTVVIALNKEIATKWAQEEYGRILHPQVSEATKEDISWCEAMGGRINTL